MKLTCNLSVSEAQTMIANDRGYNIVIIEGVTTGPKDFTAADMKKAVDAAKAARNTYDNDKIQIIKAVRSAFQERAYGPCVMGLADAKYFVEALMAF